MRILYLTVQVVSTLACIQGAAALHTPIARDPNGTSEADKPHDELMDKFPELAISNVPRSNVMERATSPASAALGKLASDLIMSTTTSVLAGAILNAFGGSSQVIDLSEASLQRISDLVKQQIEEAWYKRDKADSNTFLQIASLYARRSEYNFTSPEPGEFGNIDDDRELAFQYGNMAQGLLNRIILYGLKGAPLYQVLLGTWVSFRREQIFLSQLLDDINKAQGKTTTLASTARQSFRNSCKSFSDDLIEYRDAFTQEVLPRYFDYREYYIVVSNHAVSCRQTVRRRAFVGSYNEPFLTREEMNDYSNVNHEYLKYFTSCRMNKCNPSSEGRRCWEEKVAEARQWLNASMADFAPKVQGEYLTDHFDANLDFLLGAHNGTVPL
ncbi:hypothetical protein S40288_11602 [Stachybotrys chartarum IBT 40288]|nr:hypothetical protein S40288_11602 [Stachybotrys chartarum IBT 40288]